MLAVSNLHQTFNAGTSAETKALRGVELLLAPGEFAAVIGSNGAGKSTLLNSIAGVCAPDAGAKIELAGQDVTGWPEHRRARLIGRVFQNPLDGTAGALSLEQNLALALARGRGRGLRLALNRRRRAELRELVAGLGLGLEDRLGERMGGFSGGQRQAAALLMATLAEPKLLLLDEHTAALDPAAAQQIEELTAALAARGPLTTLMVTHNMHQALALGTRTIMLHQGRIALDVSGAERAALTVPELVARFRALRVADDSLLLA
ncbi:MAG TPA: ATP-binding cassette domain-containing protein [Herpetosiphonaceae bacterium]